MEEVFDCPPSCFATGGSNSIAVGFMDGIVQMANYDLTKKSFQVRTWDFRADNPRICSWKEQEGDVNALRIDNRHNVLSASSDGTIAAYEVRKRKLRMRSEMMHSELVSLCVTDKYVYAGGRDGYLEVFVHGDYGNILERIETGFEMGVDDVVELRKGLLLTCSGCSDKLRLINVMPTKKLGSAGTHGDDDGIDQLMVGYFGWIYSGFDVHICQFYQILAACWNSQEDSSSSGGGYKKEETCSQRGVLFFILM
ncbi:hypothetical protein ANCDUO_04494 [Ancylostoma duodenale]|uniref:WD domain, G-beta repeat protein n=1 Tax=Ancylostoma duodenale TaxID=51022 RepID=A0A0C2D6E2_9BILA|nr:hypothetical protein ANCDUO_04494 [Ancylostoma duodenale]